MCPSLPIIWKLLWLVVWPVRVLWWWIAEGAFRCSLYLSPKVLEVSPMYSSSQPRLLHWYLYMAPLWLSIGSLSLGETQKVFDGFATLEVSLDAISTTDPFDTFTKTLCVGYDNVTLTLHSMVGRLGRIVAPIIDLSGRPVKSFLHFVQGPFGVVAFSESFLRCCSSFWSNSGLLHTVEALWERVWMTLNLAERVMVTVPL